MVEDDGNGRHGLQIVHGLQRGGARDEQKKSKISGGQQRALIQGRRAVQQVILTMVAMELKTSGPDPRMIVCAWTQASTPKITTQWAAALMVVRMSRRREGSLSFKILQGACGQSSRGKGGGGRSTALTSRTCRSRNSIYDPSICPPSSLSSCKIALSCLELNAGLRIRAGVAPWESVRMRVP
jgi:hypothetical protein